MSIEVRDGSALWSDVRCAIGADSNVLISGADQAARFGVARLIHGAGQGRGGPLTVPGPLSSVDQLLSAVARLESARPAAGTLYISEVAALTPAVQAELLRVLARPCHTERSAALRSTRVIAASAHNLLDRLASNRFDPDLLYRLNSIHVALPSQIDLPGWLK